MISGCWMRQNLNGAEFLKWKCLSEANWRARHDSNWLFPKMMDNPQHCCLLLGNSKCKLCPINWTSLKKKCYWVSKDKKDWLWAYGDCTRKRAQMLIVRDLEELVMGILCLEKPYREYKIHQKRCLILVGLLFWLHSDVKNKLWTF